MGRFLGFGGTFKGVSYALIVFEFFGAGGNGVLASTKAYPIK